MNIENFIKDLVPELQEKARMCSSAEELLALAKDAKVPLPDKALAAIAGGDQPDPDNCGNPECPNCGSDDTTKVRQDASYTYWKCKSCGYQWKHELWN